MSATYTFRDMLAFLKTLTEKQLDMSATVYDADEDEAYEIEVDDIVKKDSALDGILDVGHPYFTCNLETSAGGSGSPNLDCEVMNAADFFSNERSECTDKQFARMIVDKLEGDGITVSIKYVLDILAEN